MKDYYADNSVTSSPIGEILVGGPIVSPVTIAQVRDAMSKFGSNFNIGTLAQNYNQAIAKKGWTSVMPKLHFTNEPVPKGFVLPPPFGSP